jgi:hypothetical protein
MVRKVTFHFFNAIILGVGLFFVMLNVCEQNEGSVEYSDGLLDGIQAGFMVMLGSTVFIAVYLFESNLDLITELREQVTIAVEGLSQHYSAFIYYYYLKKIMEY